MYARTGKQKIQAAELRATEILEDAQKEGENLKREKLLEVKDDFIKKKGLLEEEQARRREKLRGFETQLKTRQENIEKNLAKKLESSTRREKDLLVQQKEVQKKSEQLDEQKKAIELQRRQIDNLKATIEQQKKMSDELLKLPYMLRLARATVRNVRTNVAISLGLKLAFLAMAVSGTATLWMAVLADTGATIIVVANALRLLRQR
jgi:predicted RNase H-like nuclease (RuvC/YqgF family)